MAEIDSASNCVLYKVLNYKVLNSDSTSRALGNLVEGEKEDLPVVISRHFYSRLLMVSSQASHRAQMYLVVGEGGIILRLMTWRSCLVCLDRRTRPQEIRETVMMEVISLSDVCGSSDFVLMAICLDRVGAHPRFLSFVIAMIHGHNSVPGATLMTKKVPLICPY